MSKYNVLARRNSNSDWTAWTNTDSKRTAAHAIKGIMSYGYQWTLENPMTHTSFLTTCYAKGISPARAKLFAKGRTHFTTHDINYLMQEEHERGKE
jgi:hypothetical protein